MNNTKIYNEMKLIEIFKTIRRAYLGVYDNDDDKLSELKKEIKDIKISNPSDDRKNLQSDRNNVSKDLKVSLEKYEACDI
mgnify:CR=1 FL=1